MLYVCTICALSFLNEKGKWWLLRSLCCLCVHVHKWAPGSLGDWMQPQCSIVNPLTPNIFYICCAVSPLNSWTTYIYITDCVSKFGGIFFTPIRLTALACNASRPLKVRLSCRSQTVSPPPQQKSKHRLQQVADYQPEDRLKEGTQIFILLSVQQKVWRKVRLRTSTKTAHHSLCWCCFSQKFFICWLSRPSCTTSNT